MAYKPQLTPGGYPYLDGSGTFPQLVAGLKWIAETHEDLGKALRDDIESVRKLLDGSFVERGPLTVTHVNYATSPGRWTVSSGATATSIGLPVEAGGLLDVISWGPLVVQQYYSSGGNFQRWQLSGGWAPWRPIGGRPESRLDSLGPTADLDTMTLPGRWAVLGGSTAATLELPYGVGGIFEVVAWGPLAQQVWSTESKGIWTRWQGSTGWHPWRPVGGFPDAEISSISSTENIDELVGPGSWSIQSGATATALGLPVPVNGILQQRYNYRIAFQEYITASSRWERWRGSTAWLPWARVDGRDLEARAGGSGGPGSGSGTGIKTLPVSLSLSQGSGEGPLSATVRIPATFNAPITRWRLHLRNRMPRFGTAGLAKTSAVTVSDVYVGDSAGNGAMANPVKACAMPNIPEGSSDTVGPWVSTVSLGGNASRMLSFSYTTAAAPWQLVGGCWTTSAGHEAAANPPGLERKAGAPFQLWLEVETPSTTPALAGYGDSLTCGVGATTPVHDSWLSVYCRRVGALPVHYAASGDNMGGWEDPAAYKWQQWVGLDKPDAVVWAMGSNEMSAEQTELRRRHKAVSDLLDRFVSPVKYAATIMPRNGATPEWEANRRTYNTWLSTLPNGVRDVFDFAGSISTDDDTILPQYNADGTHLTTAGYVANADAITRPVAPPLVDTGYDSGWWRLDRPATITGGNVFMRRKNDQVDMMIFGVVAASAGHTTIAAVPVGFRPQDFTGANWRHGPVMDDAGTSLRQASYFAGNMRVLNAETGKAYGGYITWITSDPKPTTLPGTAT